MVYLPVWKMDIINVNPKSGAKLWAQKAGVQDGPESQKHQQNY